MTQKFYKDFVIKGIIKPMLDAGEDFILEEDRDSSHGPAENQNLVQRYKDEISLRYYLNPPSSPDISVCEKSFQPLKHFLSNTGHWDKKTLK